MENFLLNQTAIITGASSGIGKAIALKFASQGARVILFGTHVGRGAAAVEEITQATPGCSAEFFQVDVSNYQAVQDAMAEILKTYKTVDILVNNAGITKDQLLMRMTEEQWDSVLDVNVKSCYNTCHALVRPMMKAKKGKIINMSSVVGITGNMGQTNYAASKAAVIGFTKSLAKELGSRQIQVNCLAPGYIITAMTETLPEPVKAAVLTNIPLGHFGQTEDIANAALFLASKMSDYITGQVIAIDGGMSM
ncbi:MAG: 3-oxoacyl-[acyl-carrier-protein] reductase [Parachlamydiaceae bacterium]|nr:3-oxoacyl-[acyl-carrier-protein] reductase [Parachlamydiaceae bacterium]